MFQSSRFILSFYFFDFSYLTTIDSVLSKNLDQQWILISSTNDFSTGNNRFLNLSAFLLHHYHHSHHSRSFLVSLFVFPHQHFLLHSLHMLFIFVYELMSYLRFLLFTNILIFNFILLWFFACTCLENYMFSWLLIEGDAIATPLCYCFYFEW